METIDVARLADWAQGRLLGEAATVPVGPDVVIDSRAVTPGAVFVSILGSRADGHDFVAMAAAQGAAAALVERPVEAAIAQVLVSDSIAALGHLARAAVDDAARRHGLRVVAVTGSSGKTTTKDLIAQTLAMVGPTVAPQGSFNNEVGVPLTALQIDAQTRFLVSEMGARGLGHVAWLCGITPPQVGVVLNVGRAHLGEFGSQEAVAAAKGEIVEALDTDGWAVLNADDPLVSAMASRTAARLASFSAAGAPDERAALRVWASAVTGDAWLRPSFALHAAGAVTGTAPVRLTLTGQHNVANALAAAAAALTCGMTVEAVAAALSAAAVRSPWRMQLDRRSDGLVVLNDSYNANPDSMAAALDATGPLRQPGGRLIAVLGDMLELGETAPQAHLEAGRHAARVGIDVLIAVGEQAGELVRGFGSGKDGRVVANRAEAAATVAGLAGARDVVLVKASRGLALESVADGLLNEGAGR